jgi:hypothetical protein
MATDGRGPRRFGGELRFEQCIGITAPGITTLRQYERVASEFLVHSQPGEPKVHQWIEPAATKRQRCNRIDTNVVTRRVRAFMRDNKLAFLRGITNLEICWHYDLRVPRTYEHWRTEVAAIKAIRIPR